MAAQIGRAVLTDPITLVQASGRKGAGFLLLLPVYEGRDDPQGLQGTAEDRWARTVGWTYSPLLVDEIVNSLSFHEGDFDLRLIDKGHPANADRHVGPELFYQSGFAPETDHTTGRFDVAVPLPVYSQTWEVDLRPTQQFLASNPLPSPGMIGLIGVCGSTLLALGVYLGLMNLRRRNLVRLGERRLAQMIEISNDAIIGHDLDGTVVSWNRAATAIFGFEESEAIGRPLDDLLAPGARLYEDETLMKGMLEQVGRGKKAPHFVARRRCKDGGVLDVSVTLSPLRDERGEIVGGVKTVRDITDRMNFERRLQSLVEQFRLAVETARLGMWMWSPNGHEVHWDRRMHELFQLPFQDPEDGLEFQRVDPQLWRERVIPEDLSALLMTLRRARHERQGFSKEFRISLPGGQVWHLQAAATVEADGRVIGICRDRTEEQVTADLMRQANQRLEIQVAERTASLNAALQMATEASSAKSEFLANMSHEIRTPLNAILGLSYLMQRQTLDESTRSMVNDIHRAGLGLQALISNILDLSKIEARRLDLELQPFDLAEVLEHMTHILRPMTAGKAIELVVRAPDRNPGPLIGDRVRLGQVLINLAGNAIKFTSQGEVVVRIYELAGAAPDHVHLRFSVRDTGIGITADKLRTIFDAFTQADTSTTRRFGGTGLGLTISQRLIELMGGEIQVSSTPGKGSEFRFDLELPRAAAGVAGVGGVPGRSMQRKTGPLRALIADDHPEALDALGSTAGQLGWNVVGVKDGREVLEVLETQSPDDFDVLVLDWRMPQLDGLSTLAEVEQRFGKHNLPSVILVTADDRETLARQPKSQLADAVLSKPVTASDLFNATAGLMYEEGDTPESPPGLALGGVRLLVVDDSEINRAVAARIFEAAGAKVNLAEDGLAALDWLRIHAAEVDAVLMDIHMPVMDGLTATREIRARRETARLPVLAVSAGLLSGERDQARQAGMNAFIAKPFDVELALRTILEQVHPGISSLAKPIKSRPHPKDSLSANPLDVEAGLEIWREPAVYQGYLQRFDQDIDTALLHMAESLAASNLAGLADLAHRMRGSSANLALPAVATLSAQLEGRCRALAADGVDLQANTDARDVLKVLLEQLSTVLQAARDAIQRYCATPQELAPTAPPALLQVEVSAEILRPVLERLEQAFMDQEPERIESVMFDFELLARPEQALPLRRLLMDFDFPGGLAAVRQMLGSSQAPASSTTPSSPQETSHADRPAADRR